MFADGCRGRAGGGAPGGGPRPAYRAYSRSEAAAAGRRPQPSVLRSSRVKSSLAFRAVSGHGVWSGRCGEGEGGSGQFDAERLSRVRCLRRSMQCTCLRLVLDRSLGACNRCRGSAASGLHRAWRLSRSKLGQRLGRLGVGLACQCHTRFRLCPSRSGCGSHAPPCVLQQSQRQAGGGQASWPGGGRGVCRRHGPQVVLGRLPLGHRVLEEFLGRLRQVRLLR